MTKLSDTQRVILSATAQHEMGLARAPKTLPAAARNQENSLAAFLAKKVEFDALLAELQQASADHFGADPETVLWGEAAWLSDATAKLKDIADQHFRRGEYET